MIFPMGVETHSLFRPYVVALPDNVEFNEEVEDMLERTRSNPNAIIYGTFYSYPVM
jgi:hypothetical protein